MEFFPIHAGEIIGARIEAVRKKRIWNLEREKQVIRQMMRQERQ